MRDYSVVHSAFWTGETGRSLRGDPDGQRMAFYLLTAPGSNMIGLYYLPMPTICHEIGMTIKGASKALRRVAELGFASYDFASEWVWVMEMAHFQLGSKVVERDKRHKGVLRQLRDARKSPFIKDFWDRYGAPFELPEIESIQKPEAPSKPLQRGTVLGLGPVPVLDPVLDLSSKATDEFFEVWNATKGVVRMAKLTPQRRKAIQARLDDSNWLWREALAKFPLKCFASEPDGWQPNLDFFLRPNSVAKILEGTYDWQKGSGSRNKQILLPDGGTI